MQRAGETVLLIHHNRGVAASIQEKGVRIRELSGKVVCVQIQTRTKLSRLDKPDIVLVTVKAYDSEAVASLLKKSLVDNVPVLSIQNGLGNVEELTHRLGADSTIAGTTTEGAMTTGPGAVIHTGRGSTWLGEMNGKLTDRCLTIEKALRKAGFITVISNNIKGVLWAKAIVNSAINPITAITQVRNGDIRRIPELHKAASKVVDEGVAVAQANGILLKPSPKSLLANILVGTLCNKSSMLQDIESGRKTEIRQLNGSISRQGNLVGVRTPFNDLLTNLVVALERPQRNL